MDKLKILMEKRYALVREMEAATEKREFEKFDALNAELTDLDAEITALKNKTCKIQTASEDNLLRAAEMTEKQFTREFSNGSNNVKFGDFTRALLFNDGEFRNSTNVDGSVIVPQEIAAEVIYKAINNSVILRKTPMIPMEAPITIIGRVKDNVEVDFKEKLATGLKTGMGLEGVKLEAKTLYAWVNLAEEDMQDVVNLEAILRTAFAEALAETVDKNFLYTNAASSGKPGVYPKGIMDSATINKITVDSMDYDAILKGSLEIAKNNGDANAVGINPTDMFGIHMLKDSLGQYIKAPGGLPTDMYTMSNGLKTGDMLVFDSNAIVVGIRKEMDIKMMPDLTSGNVIIRIMFRCDVATTQDKHICKVTTNK